MAETHTPQTGLPDPDGETREAREITYEWELTNHQDTRELVVLTITHQRAGLDIDAGQRLPSRYEAELTNETALPPIHGAFPRLIPFTGLRICWEQTPRFSKQGIDVFADTALERLRGLYRWGDANVLAYFERPVVPETSHAAQRLRRLKALVAKRTPSDWGQSHVAVELAQDPDSPSARCPRFAGIVEESGDEAVILADTEADLAYEMAARFTSDIPIRPIELIDLDTEQHRLAICEATVRFAQPAPADPSRPTGGSQPQ